MGKARKPHIGVGMIRYCQILHAIPAGSISFAEQYVNTMGLYGTQRNVKKCEANEVPAACARGEDSGPHLLCLTNFPTAVPLALNPKPWDLKPV